MYDLRRCPSFLADPTPPSTPPRSPSPAKKVSFADPIETKAEDSGATEYEILNAQLRRRIQDYEVALLRMQLRQREKELHALLKGKQTEDQVAELELRVGKQEETIESLLAEVAMWKGCALEARMMLGLTYKDLEKVDSAERVAAT